MIAPTYEEVRSLLIYEQDTGRLLWRERGPHLFKLERDRSMWNTRYAGKDAGTPHASGSTVSGYTVVNICGQRVLAHRLMWLIAKGEWPDQIDHVNGDRSDNRLCNLRSVSGPENHKNMRRPKNNTSGVIGVCWDAKKSKWMAAIKVSRRNHFLGYFDSVESAAAARKTAEQGYGFHENHGRAA